MNTTLLTDLYQLTMMAAYAANDKEDQIATFDLFIRKLPKDWGYFIANGIEDAVDYITNIEFDDSDIDYLREQNLFNEDFLNSLKDFKFEGDVYAVKEGTVVPENVPIMRITAPRSQAQLLESRLLNIINFQTMIATKANRVVNAAEGRPVADFGLRRAQEETAAMKGSRAAYIGGCVSTSNVKAGKEYGIPISGTHAHSFVMSFDTEIEAFRAYAKAFPDKPTLLIDTYDVMQGAKNAAIVARELEAKGKQLGAVRLDSGDLTEDSKQVREFFDSVGLDYVTILASNDLNEYKIADMHENGAKTGGYGVGTEMITAKPVTAVSGVYKLAEDTDEAGNLVPKIKLAEGKRTLPGKKQLYRVQGVDVYWVEGDERRKVEYIIGLDGELDNMPGIEALLQPAVIEGKPVYQKSPLNETREYVRKEVEMLSSVYKGVRAEKQLKASVTPKLEALTQSLVDQYHKDNEEVM
ncbi:MAG: nicotinate phosphoribosyltransferase [Candidatus Woesearchaeota archaeon]